MHDRHARGAQLVTQFLAEVGLVHRVHVGNETGCGHTTRHAFGSDRGRPGVEQAEHDRHVEIQVGEKADLLDQGTHAVASHLSARCDQGEALFRQLPKEAQVELRLGTPAHALEKREDDRRRG